MISIVFLLKKKKKMRKKKNYNPFTIKIVVAKQTCNVKQSIKEKKKKNPCKKSKEHQSDLLFYRRKIKEQESIQEFTFSSIKI